MNEQSVLFIKNCIRNYYKNNKPDYPSLMPNREFAIVAFNLKGMIRPLSFDPDSLNSYLAKTAPKHVYYSAARWQDPSVKGMDEKGWIGTDFIFDIDVKPENGMTYPDALARAKQEMLKLIDCVKCDLGIHDFEIVFSGRKGYHCHLHDETLISLDGDERREIVDYITGNNGIPVVGFRRIGKDHVVMLPPAGAPGRAGMFRRSIAQQTGAFIRLDKKDEFIKNLCNIDGIGLKRAKSLYNSIIQNGGLDHAIRCNTDTCEAWKLFSDNIACSMNIPIDQPVSIDVNRVIRLPGTIHGETGLKATIVQDLETFDPLTDAVCLSERIIKILVQSPAMMEIGGHCYELQEGEAKVPEFLAVFSICCGKAEIAV